MKKITDLTGKVKIPRMKKLFRIMKLTSFFLLFSVVSVLANKTYSQAKTYTLIMEKATVKEVLSEIENQSSFYFMYNSKYIDLDREISLNTDNQKLEVVLNLLFAGTDVNYTIKDKIIVLSTPEMNGMISSQKKSVSGKVTDSSGSPLPGVTVVVKGTTQGIITDADGNYSLSNVPGDATLVFSFVGMKTQEISVAGKTSVNVKMEEETVGIEEVVAIGYGTVKKSDLTGSIASVQGDLIADKQTTQLSQALQGTMSGVMVTRNSGAADVSATIRIRGITTINDSNPLIIIDGIPGGLDDVNPNDVESISVLKDAASAAIYGSRAASGVILVTTKRAKTGQMSLDYNCEFGIEKPTRVPEYAGAIRYMEMYNEMKWNDNGNIVGNEYNTYSKDLIDNYMSLNADNPNKYPDTDWNNLLMNDYAPRQSHILSLNAGAKDIRTKISMAYDNIDALCDGRTFERITARANNDIKINKYLSASVDLHCIRSIDKRPSGFGLTVSSLRATAPIYAALWSDGRLAAGKTGANSYGKLKYGGETRSWENQ